MEIKTLEGIPIAILADTFNEAFSDYKIRFNVTEDFFRKKFEAESIKQKLSVGAFDGGRLVGFILHGVDEIDGVKSVFNGGTGVVPSHRGRRITEAMYIYALQILCTAGYKHHQLEVLHDNDKAKKVYLKMGFKDVRMVASFAGKVAAEIPPSITIQQVDKLDFEVLQSWCNVQPTWQNNTQCILRVASRHDFYMACLNGEEAGFAAVDTLNNRIKQFAVKPSLRRNGVGHALFSHISDKYGIVTFVNYDLSDTGSLLFFNKLGLVQDNDLYEMKLQF